MRFRFAGLTVRPKIKLYVSPHYIRRSEPHCVMTWAGMILTINVWGTFVRTNGTAPQSYSMSTRTAFLSAYLPIHDTYPAACTFVSQHSGQHFFH